MASFFRPHQQDYAVCYSLKGLSCHKLWDLLCKGLAEKRNLYQLLNFSVTPSIFGHHFKVLMRFIPKISEIPGMDSQMWAAVLGDFLLPSRRTTGKV